MGKKLSEMSLEELWLLFPIVLKEHKEEWSIWYKELVINKPQGFVIMTPQNIEWGKLIEECYTSAKQVTRYAIKKDTIFDQDKLRKNIKMLPEEYKLKKIDSDFQDLRGNNHAEKI